MKYNIGIVGPEDLVKYSAELMERYENLTPRLLPYETENDTMNIVNKNYDKVDVFLFTGFLPYFIATRQGLDLPSFFFSIAGSSLYKALFDLKVHRNIDVTKVSVDTLREESVASIYDQLNLNRKGVKVNKIGLENFNGKEYVEFHYDLYKTGQTEVGITAINSVYEQLKKEDIEIYKIIPTPQSMKKTMKLISTFVEGEIARSNQLVIQILRIDEEILDRDFTNMEKREKKLQLYQRLLKYGRKHHASIFINEDNDYVVLMNSGIFKKYTNLYESIPIIGKIEENLNIKMYMGIGMGLTAMEAEDNAREALKFSQEEEEGNAFIIDQDKKVIGPINFSSNEGLSYKMKTDDENIVSIAEKSKLSVTNLYKIKHLIEDLKNDELTSKQIKNGLGVTLRTANRIINKLVDAGIARESGYEDPAGRGRPRRIYKISM